MKPWWRPGTRSPAGPALAYSRTGELLSAFPRKHSESLAIHEKAIDLVQSILKDDPKNVDLRRIEAWEVLQTGDEIGGQGNVAGAWGKYDVALKQMQALSADDANDAQVRILMVMATQRVGSSWLQQEKAREALAELEKSFAEGSRWAKPGSSNEDLVWTLAVDQFLMGQTHVLLASEAKICAGVRREHWQQALLWFQKSMPGLKASTGGSYQEICGEYVEGGLEWCGEVRAGIEGQQYSIAPS